MRNLNHHWELKVYTILPEDKAWDDRSLKWQCDYAKLQKQGRP